MGQQVRFRKQTSKTFTAFGQKEIIPLGKGMQYRELPLRWSGSFTYAAGANNAAATLGRGDEWSAISNIAVVANGSDNIRNVTGTELRMINKLIYNNAGRPSLTLGDGATAAPTFDSTLLIPFWMFQSIRPMDTAFDSGKVTDFRLEITINTSANINSANGPTALSGTLDVLSLESWGLVGDFSDCRWFRMQFAEPGANNARQVILPVTALYRGFFINAANGSSDAVADLPNAISNVKLFSGTQVFRDIPWRVLTDWQRQRLGWDRQLDQGAASSGAISNAVSVFLNNAKNTNLNEDAWAFLDLVQDGYMTEGIDTVGFSEMVMELNIAAACTVTVIPVQVFPVRKKQAAAA